jgi:hypothetical protein
MQGPLQHWLFQQRHRLGQTIDSEREYFYCGRSYQIASKGPFSNSMILSVLLQLLKELSPTKEETDSLFYCWIF